MGHLGKYGLELLCALATKISILHQELLKNPPLFSKLLLAYALILDAHRGLASVETQLILIEARI